jgi:hypothetical protein
MAPDLALAKLAKLQSPGIVLDPMSGSGTVLRQASLLGHQALGFDMDPLAVLMSSVWTTPINAPAVARMKERIFGQIDALHPDDAQLPWIDSDPETASFVDFWFAKQQQLDLRKAAYVLRAIEADAGNEDIAVLNMAKLALSRLIITKDRGASLARDVSHSRPHKVAEANDFDVRSTFEKSIDAINSRLEQSPPEGSAKVKLGDARSMLELADGSVDGVLTSPPYLNAIDYMRGHKLSLVWLGYGLGELRGIRSDSIGSERRASHHLKSPAHLSARAAMGQIDALPARFGNMIDRYVNDIVLMVGEVARVLRSGAQATFVMGDSCLRGVFILNSQAVASAGKSSGLDLVSESVRPLPNQNRYLPMTSAQLSKRMRTETILTFQAP